MYNLPSAWFFSRFIWNLTFLCLRLWCQENGSNLLRGASGQFAQQRLGIFYALVITAVAYYVK